MSGDKIRGRGKTPPAGSPVIDELSIPVLVDAPAMSRTRTASEPPRMTHQEFARQSTIERQRLERDHGLLAAKVDGMGERVGTLQTDWARHDERIIRVEENLGEFESIASFREDVQRRLADGFGKDGANGKLGALKAQVEKAEGWRKTIIMFALGLLMTAGGVVFWAGSTVAGLESDLRHVESDVSYLRRAILRGSGSHPTPDPTANLEPQP